MNTSTKPRKNKIAQHVTSTDALYWATYMRISLDLHDGAGVERQTIDTDGIVEREGGTLVERISDNDRGASRHSKKTREGWDHLLSLIESGKINAVAAYDLDRMTRQPKELERLIDYADKGALRIRTATGILDLSTSAGRMIARTLCAVAAHEADRLSERAQRKYLDDAEQGRPHWSVRPFGYRTDGTIVMEESLLICSMYERAVAGHSLNSIAKWLNSLGSVTVAGKQWGSGAVTLLLRSPRNAGFRVYKGEIVGEGTWEPIVSEETWRAACAAMAARSTGSRTGGKVMMLTRLAYCGECGKQMWRTGSGGRVQYRCLRTADGSDRGGCGVAVTAHLVDEVVSVALAGRVGEARRSAPNAKITDNRASIVEALRSDLRDLAAMLGADEMSMAEYKAAREPMQARLAAAEAALAQSDLTTALGQLTNADAALVDQWDDLDGALQNRIARTMIERVRLMRPSADAPKRFTRERVVIDWRNL